MYEGILKAGEEFSIAPCGLAARDLLRLEAALPLYGQELSEEFLATEVGLEFTVKLDKQSFLAKKALLKNPPKYTRAGALVFGGIAREGDLVFCGEIMVGSVTSGTHSPTLKKPIAMLRIKKEYSDKNLTVVVRGRVLNLEITGLQFYKKSY